MRLGPGPYHDALYPRADALHVRVESYPGWSEQVRGGWGSGAEPATPYEAEHEIYPDVWLSRRPSSS